jgi:hypothetical protein
MIGTIIEKYSEFNPIKPVIDEYIELYRKFIVYAVKMLVNGECSVRGGVGKETKMTELVCKIFITGHNI